MVKTSSWLAARLHRYLAPIDCDQRQSTINDSANPAGGLSGAEAQLEELLQHCTLQPVAAAAFEGSGVELSVLRLETLCPALGGNKIFKLYGHLQHYFKTNCKRPIASFGGAYSNHLYALAHSCHALGIACVGFIRGEPSATPSATLADLEALGMTLRFVNRADYRSKHDPDWQAAQGDYYWIPEGGGGQRGLLGCVAIGRFVARLQPDCVALACGTGTTLAGVYAGLGDTPVVGVSALKGARDYLENEIKQLVSQLELATLPFGVQNSRVALPGLHIVDEFHCGGFGRHPAYLADFVARFESESHIPLDPVYTSKLMWGIAELMRRRYWPPGTRVIAIHTGGLQGRRGRQQLQINGAN